MLVSRWPIEGSIYQWSRRLLGTGYGWFAGWAYMWTLVIAMATVALGAAGFVANVAGIEAPTGRQRAVIAFVILLLGTAVNLVGRTGAEDLHERQHHRRGRRVPRAWAPGCCCSTGTTP